MTQNFENVPPILKNTPFALYSTDLHLMDLMFLLLADDAGAKADDVNLLALAGLAELTMKERIEFDGMNLAVKSRDSVDHAATDELLGLLRETMPVNDLADLSLYHILKKQRESLVARQICREQKKRVLLLFSVLVYPLINVAPKQTLHHTIRTAVLGDEQVPEDVAVLIAIERGWEQAIWLPLSQEERKTRQKRIGQISTISPLTVSVETCARLLQQEMTMRASTVSCGGGCGGCGGGG